MTIPSWAKVGAKVVCKGDFKPSKYGEDVPRSGVVYTIRCINVMPNGVGLRFDQIRNAPRRYKEDFAEASFSIKDFRPVQTKTLEQDMEIFAPLLETEKEMVE